MTSSVNPYNAEARAKAVWGGALAGMARTVVDCWSRAVFLPYRLRFNLLKIVLL